MQVFRKVSRQCDRDYNGKRSVADPSLECVIMRRVYKEYSGGLVAELLSHQWVLSIGHSIRIRSGVLLLEGLIIIKMAERCMTMRKLYLAMGDGVCGATKIDWNKDGAFRFWREDGSWYASHDFHQFILKNKVPASNMITGGTAATICLHLANKIMYFDIPQ